MRPVTGALQKPIGTDLVLYAWEFLGASPRGRVRMSFFVHLPEHFPTAPIEHSLSARHYLVRMSTHDLFSP